MKKSFTWLFSLVVIMLGLGTGTVLGQTYVPEDNATNVDKEEEVSVTFESDVTKGSGYVRFYEDGGTDPDVPLFVELVSDSRIVVSGKKVVFPFDNLMEDSKDYYVTWDAGAFKLGTTNVDALAVGDWNWTTGDYTAPVLDVKSNGSHLVPKNGATNVATTTTTLSLLFKEAVQPTIGDERVYLMEDNGTDLGDVVQILTKADMAVSASNTIELTVNALQENSSYYVMVEEGAIVDASGNANKFAGFSGKSTWSFSTKDASAPVMTITESEVTKTKVTYNVEFSEKGKLYYVVVPQGSDEPTSEEVRAQVDYSPVTLEENGTATYTEAGTKVVEETLTNTVQSGTEYDYYFVSETYINVDGVTETLYSPPVKKEVKMVDNVKPTAGPFVPVNNASAVAKDQKLKITFDEKIMLGTGNVTVKKVTDNSTFATFDITGATVSDNELSVEIDLPQNFASSTAYYVLIPSGVITDLAGNAYAGITSTTVWNFTAEDYAAPTYTFSPANGSTTATAADLNDATTGGIKITFNEDIYHRDGGAIADNVDVGSNGLNQALILKEDGEEVAMDYTVSGNVITITKEGTATFNADTEYSLTFLAWYVADADGNIIQSSSELVFNTLDNVTPFVKSIKPDDIVATSNITINFSEAMTVGGAALTDANVDGVIITFLEANTTPVDFDATVSADKTQIIIDPAVNLKSSVTYNITLSATLEDDSDNAITATGGLDYSNLTFTVNDYVKPVATLTPTDGASIAAGTLSGSVAFSEAVTKVIGGGDPDKSVVTLREGSATGPAIDITVTGYASNTLSFTAPIDAAKTYYLTVAAALEDDAGNVNDAKTSVFTTLSSDAPTIALDGDDDKIVTPLEDATGVTSSAVISVTFADPIAAVVNEGDISITDGSAGTITVTGSSLSADGKTLTILHDALPANETVTVTLNIGSVQSETGTALSGPLSWSFYTEDTIAPSSPTLSPTGTGVGIASTGTSATELTLTFPNTDDLHIGTGEVKIRLVSNDAIVQSIGTGNISVSSAADDATDEIVTVELNADLDYQTDYYVQVPATLILDAENNAYSGIFSKAGWTFTTEGAPAFAVDIANSNPTEYQDSVLETDPFIVMFNHDVDSYDNSQNISLDEVTFTAAATPTVNLVENIWELPPSDPAFTWAGDQLTIDYASVDLEPNKAYRLTFDAGVATDVYGGGLTETSWVFFTSSRQGPMASFSPADEAEDVAKGTNIVITFDEAFYKDASMGTYTAVELQDDPTIINVAGTASGADLGYIATIDGMAITLDLDADLASTEDVTVTVGAGKFYDAAGNMYDADMNGTGDAQTATFTVEDFVPPTASITGAAVTNLTGTGFKYKVQSTEKGTVYSIVMLASATAPSKAEVMAGTTTAITEVNTPSSNITVSDLTPSTEYTLYYYGVDATGNEQEVQSMDVTTIDDVAPVLVAMLPEDGAATTADIELEFDEDMASIVNGAVLLKDKATGTIIESFSTASVVDETISFDPTMLESSTTYVVEIDPGTFTDNATIPNSYDSFITWEFTTADEIAPTVKLTTPNNAGGKFNVEEATGLVLTFSEAVQAGDTNVEVYEDVDGSGAVNTGDILVQLIDPASMTASDDNKTRTFDVTAPLTQDESYLIVVNAGSFMDMAENEVVAYTGRIDIVDTSAPVASHTYSTPPAEDDTDVAISASIIINFDEAIYWSVNPVTGYLYDANVDSLVTLTGPNGAVPFDATISADAKTITIDPTNNLMSTSTYVVTASQIQDASANLMDTYSFSFTTGEFTPPIATFDPAHDTEDVSAVGPFTITFDKDVYVFVDLTTGLPVLAPLTTENVADYITLVTGDDISSGTPVDFTATVTDGKVITITPDEALDASGSDMYTYGIKVYDGEGEYGEELFDNLGNGIEGTSEEDAADSTYATFTVEDLTEPDLVDKSPVDGTDVDATMMMLFDSDMAIGTGNLYIRRVVDGELMETIAANEENLTVVDDTVFIQHADFALNTKYYVVIDEGFVTDLSGNPYEGIADDQVIYDPTNAPDAWNFNTEDTNRPMLVDQSPAPGAVDVLVGQVLTMTFNKGVVEGTGYISIYRADGTPHEMIDVTSGSVVFSQYAADTVVTISHVEFEPETEYFVRVDAGAIEDNAGNAFDGIADESWSFITEDVTAPSLDFLNPEDNSIDVPVDQVFEMTFDRNVSKGNGNIKIYDRSGETLVESIAVSDSSVVITDNMVSFQFSAELDTMAEYYIIVEPGAITNASVNAIPFEGITTALEWNFTTAGEEVLALVEWAPTGTITEYHPDFTMDFNMPVVLSEAGGNLMVYEMDSTTATLDIALTADMFDGSMVTVTYEEAVSGMLEANTEYYVLVDDAAVEDTTGNAWAGIADETVWTFATGDFEYTIADVQSYGDVSVHVGSEFELTGTVTAVIDSVGFMMQDDNAAWSGIWVEFANTPDTLEIGDGVTVVGVVAEVDDVTTLQATSVVEADAPITVEAVVMDGPSDAVSEMWESVLVQVVGARATATDSTSGQWEIYYEMNDSVVVNKWFYPYTSVEDHYYHVTGVVNGKLNAYMLEPRMDTDIVDITETTDVPEMEVVDFNIYPNPFTDHITIDNSEKVARVIVVNIAGQRVMDVEYPSREIYTGNLVSGVYVISLITEDGQRAKSERMIKR